MKDTRRNPRLLGMLTVALTLLGAAAQATVPEMLRYQARLSDDAGVPMTGTVSLSFAIWDSEFDGSTLWSTEGSIPVNLDLTNGVVDILVGESDPIPPSLFGGPERWLEVTVEGSVLSPRQRLVSVPYAHAAGSLGGREAAEFLDTSANPQTKAGQLTVTPGGTYGVEAYGSYSGGFFKDATESGQAYVGIGGSGIRGEGNFAGGVFYDLDQSGYAYVGFDDFGIQAWGNWAGAFFDDSNGSGAAYLGYGDQGVEARGSVRGGYFYDTDSSGAAYLAEGDYGIKSQGTVMGGYFIDSNGSGYANVGVGNYGIDAWGNDAGGVFNDRDNGSYAEVATGDFGVRGYGNSYGVVGYDADNSGEGRLGQGDVGVVALGTGYAGYFSDTNSSSYVFVANGDHGIEANGNEYAVFGMDLTSFVSAYLANDTASTSGSGSKDFIQNHPYDPGLVVRYSSLEGDEVGTYTRGSARLSGGEARVKLGETFQWVTHPEMGLTAHLTPRGGWAELYVASLSTSELVVRSRDAAADTAFDYVVHGLRIGFEEVSPLREKEREVPIPSMASHRDLYARRPELQRFNARERFTGMSAVFGDTATIDTGAADALRAAVTVFDPAVHELPPRPDFSLPGAPGEEAAAAAPASAAEVRAPAASPSRASPPDRPPLVPPQGLSSTPSAAPSVLRTDRPLSVGTVLVIHPDRPGLVAPGEEANDPAVIGIAAGVAEDEEEGVYRVAVAVSGIVLCRVDAAYGAIRPGDLLAVSKTPGHAMRVEDPLPGTVLGKALETLEEGTGLIQVVVTLR